MKYKIGISGSAEGNQEEVISKAQEVGRLLSKNKVIIITGASSGLPYETARIAYENKTEIWGFSKGFDLKTQEELNPEINSSIFSKIIYIPKNFKFANNPRICMKYRNVTWTASCDAGIIISGRWGSLNEFTNLYDMEKIIGVLTETGGVADELEALSKKIHKPGRAKIIFDNNPKRLVESIILALENKNDIS